MTPIPVCLPLPLVSALPIHISVMALLPVDTPGALFMFIEIVVVPVMPVVDVVVVVAVVVIVILRH